MHHQTHCGCEPHSYERGPCMADSHNKWHGHRGYPSGGGMHHGSDSCSCGCHHGSGISHGHGEMINRRFASKEELIAKLEEYLKQLQSEAQGVKEHIVELRKES